LLLYLFFRRSLFYYNRPITNKKRAVARFLLKGVLLITMDREKSHVCKNKHSQKDSPNHIFIDPAEKAFLYGKGGL